MVIRATRAASIGVFAATSVVAWAAFAVLLPPALRLDVPEPAIDRIVFALPLAAWPATMVLAMTVAVALTRLADRAFDPLADAPSRLYQTGQRVLTNTVEQTIVFLPLLLVAATTLPADWMGALRLCLLFFLAGRVFFWAGYLVHPLMRAPGMALTLNVNGGLAVATIAGLLLHAA